MNGRTVVGRSDPPARPQAATAPRYFVCASTVPSVWLPTVSMAAAQRSFSSGLPEAPESSSRPTMEVAPSDVRYSAISGRPVAAATR